MHPTPTFVLIYGPPGVGKLTVASELCGLTGAILFDNHMSIEWTQRIFPDRAQASESFGRLRDALREAVLGEAGRAGKNIVMTFVYADPGDDERVEGMLRAFEQHGGRVCPVQLMCEQSEHEVRLQSPGRAERAKMTRPARLREVMAAANLTSRIRTREGMAFDTTGQSAAETAEQIASYLSLAE